MKKLVSIVMPSYNTAKFIEESIKSVLDQTYTNWELIIVDDCSKDNTDEVVKKFLSDKRIKYLKNKKNSGAAFSRNYALREAKGKFIAFLDSDDLWFPDKLEKQLQFMEKNNYAFTYTNYKEIDEKSKDLNVIVTGPKKISKTGMYNYCYPGCLTVIYDVEKIGLIQIENIPKNNDYAMWLKVIKKSKNCFLLNEVLASYRKRSHSISSGSKLKLIKHHYILYKIGEKKNSITSIILTLRNIFFGILKKKIYVKKSK
ncbi:MAG: glycosyltransferase family 2 protein [Bacilli bacterium]|nr:glycosyltransferase family 2 protein [Bacilli bacterium]